MLLVASSAQNIKISTNYYTSTTRTIWSHQKFTNKSKLP